jgi:hypothetical protein
VTLARERAVREQLSQVPQLAAIRREALWELHAALGSWRKVGAAIGISGQSAHKAARGQAEA